MEVVGTSWVAGDYFPLDGLVYFEMADAQRLFALIHSTTNAQIPLL